MRAAACGVTDDVTDDVTDRDGATPALLDERAARWAARLASPVRRSSPGEAAALQRDIRAELPAADRAARAWSGLGSDLPPTPLRVVSRTGWVEANLVALRGAFEPLAGKLTRRPPLAAQALGAQLGALLGLLSTKVLGQYVLPLGADRPGQLVLVGPNLLELDDRFGALADDVRRCVLVHEVVHRLQFEAVGWLADHLRGILRRYLEAARVDASAVAELVSNMPEAVRRVRDTGSLMPLLETVLTEEQLAAVEEAQGLMSLLEGHGNAAMFRATGDLVRDPERVRAALEERRTDVTTRVLAAVAGLELKRRQYAEGEAFVAAVVDDAGIPALNRAFAAAENLPSHQEISQPHEWMARVAAA